MVYVLYDPHFFIKIGYREFRSIKNKLLLIVDNIKRK